MRSPSPYYQRFPRTYMATPVPIGQGLILPSETEPPNENRRVSESISTGITEGVQDAFKQITLPVIAVAIVTGASFAIGAWIAHRFIIPRGK